LLCSDSLTRLQALQSLSARLKSIQVDIARTAQLRARWANLAAAESVVSAIPALTERIAALTRTSAELTRIRHARVLAENDRDLHAKAMRDAQSLYADTLIALGTCPVCGSSVDPASLSLHIKEVA